MSVELVTLGDVEDLRDTLFVESIAIEGFRCIKSSSLTFQHHNALVGGNGVGKTCTLEMIATIAGSDDATDIFGNSPIGRVELTLGFNDERYRFETTDLLCKNKIREFKSTLPRGRRINFGLSEEMGDRFSFGSCNYATRLEMLKEYLLPGMHVFNRKTSHYAVDPGDGFKKIILLSLLASMPDSTLLMDVPEAHLDYQNKRRLSTRMTDTTQQTISVVNSPEWLTKFLNSWREPLT